MIPGLILRDPNRLHNANSMLDPGQISNRDDASATAAESQTPSRNQGIILSRNQQSMLIRVFGGATIAVNPKEVQRIEKMDASLMLTAANMGLRAQDVRNIAEYLKTIGALQETAQAGNK